MTGFGAVAAWTGPALAVVLAGRVARGDADAPLLVLVAAVAPLVALLASARRAPAPDRSIAAAVRLACAGLLTGASLLAAGDVASALGAARWQGVVVAGALAALPALLPGTRWSLLLPLGLAALAGATLVVGAATHLPPWRAWAESAARPAFRFAAGGAWVDGGGRVDRRTTVEFAEGQRVTAMAPGSFRVVEREQTQTTTRDWRLAAGDTLTLRPGDRLTLEAGARVRFEVGARVPGAPISGAAWADPAERGRPQRLVVWLGAFVTLVVGAAALAISDALPRDAFTRDALTRVDGLTAIASAFALPLAAACWGIYAAATPEHLLGGADGAVFAGLPPQAASSGGAVVTALACGGLVALLLAATHALLGRLAGPLGPRRGMAWLGVVVAAGVGALWPFDPWRALMLGWGLSAAAWAAPALGARDAVSATAGAWTGALAWAALAGLDLRGGLPPWAVGLGEAPALVAAPLAWLVARAVGAWRVGNGRRPLTQ